MSNGAPKPLDESTLWRASAITALLNFGFVAATLVALYKFSSGDDDDDKSDDDGGPDLSSPVGWVAVAGAIWVFGSYGILIKLPAVAATHPQVFQIYFSAGVALTSLLVLCWTPFVFSLWGFVGAAIWVASMLCAFVGIQGLGYGTAVATWASITMTVAFLWGTLVFGEAPSNIGGAVAALLVLGVGVAGVATAQSPSWQPSDNGESDSLFQALNVNGDSEAGVGVGVGVGEAQDEGEGEAGGKTTTPSKTSKLAGWCGAVGCGLTNGSLMVPFHYFSEAHSGSNASIAYIASFAIGVAVVTPVGFALFFRVPFKPAPPLRPSELALPGLITGCFWAIGNLCSTYATYYLGQSVGYPLTQTCIVVAGLWGALFFGELRGWKSLSLFGVSVCAIIGGATLLGLYG